MVREQAPVPAVPGDVVNSNSVIAGPVVTSRVAIPEHAGTCNPCRAVAMRDLTRMILPEEDWLFPLPRPCRFCEQG